MEPSWKNCYICSSRDVALSHWGKDRLHYVGGKFKVLYCNDCGCYTTYPMLKRGEMARYYPANKYKAFARHGMLSGLIGRLGAMKKGRYVEKMSGSKGTLLDIGCACGDFLAWMQRLGWRVNGVEPDQRAATTAQVHGLTVFNGSLEEAQFPPQRFEVVTMWHVLEHLTAPLNSLCEVAKILKPGGVLVFCLPNVDSPNARLLGPLWSGFDTPRHAYAFSHSGLEIVAKQAGFSIVDVRCFFGGFDALNYDLKFLLEERWSAGAIRATFLASVRSMAGRVILSPFLWVLDRFNRGSVITYCLRKREC
jgi:2-polyprenyl-3-methyl-5-hydroxy-6-metoxy-1,4-benzoquinol methylase